MRWWRDYSVAAILILVGLLMIVGAVIMLTGLPGALLCAGVVLVLIGILTN